MPEIFKSMLTLSFKSQEIEHTYRKISSLTIRKYNIIYCAINLVILLINTIVYSFTFTDLINESYSFIKLTSFLLLGIQIVLLVLSLILKKFSYQKWISYISVIIIVLSNMTLRMYLATFAKVDYLVFNLVYICLQVYTMIWYFTNNLDFLEGFWVYLSIPVISYAYFCAKLPIALQFRFPINAVIMMVNIFISYFYINEKKKSFYFNFMNERTIKSYRSIIQNMNSGFISIDNSKIVKINKIINSHLMKINSMESNNDNNKNNLNDFLLLNVKSIFQIENEERSFENLEVGQTKVLLNALFSNLKFESECYVEGDKTDYEKSLQFLKNIQSTETFHKESFIFLGTKEFKYETIESSHYEIFGRYSTIFKEDKFEFLFNDVSKTKTTESINANMKYKTIFLSKVAHEFKNPLICVSELVDQINEQIESNSPRSSDNPVKYSENVKENLNQIKSMCEYLLILVKDLDFFSLQQSASTNKIKLEKENVKLDKITNYCSNVTNVLLKKYQKENNIKFSIDCNEELYKKQIFTDELRLKQLLINLLSNSVKYTHNGNITLKISEEQSNVLFNVIDSGNGLNDEQIMRLKTNVEINRVIGANTSSLGFSIIKEIIELLGSKLDYEALLNHGSMFSFFIEKDSNCDDLLECLSGRSQISITSETPTIVKKFSGMMTPETFEKLMGANSKISEKTISVYKKEENSEKTEIDLDADHFIVVDDEQITRQSTIRILNKYFNSKKEINRKKVVLEAKDGIECLNLFYECMIKGMKISCIISDQTMEFMNGGTCAKILKEITKNKGLRHVPFMILTAYENFEFDQASGIDKAYTKPICMRHIEEINLLLQNN